MGAFNGSGTFVRTYNWATDKSNSVAVTASRTDTEDDGFATGLSTCIAKDGQTTTTARIPFSLGIGISSGTAAAPSLNFTSDIDTGFYSFGANQLGVACGGALSAQFGTTGFSIQGSFVATAGVTCTSVTASAAVSVGANLGVTGSTTLSGIVTMAGIGTTASAANMFQDSGTGLIARSTSSARYKTDIQDIEPSEALSIVLNTRPIKFKSIAQADDPDRQHFGLIAEEVAEVDSRLIHRTADGAPDGVQYDRYVAPLLSVVQQQQQRIAALEAKLAEIVG